jgi:hypothetical protein
MISNAEFNPMAGNPLIDREDVARAAADLYAPLRAALSPGGAAVRLDGSGAMFPEAVVGLEAFARPLWGLAALSAGGGAVDWAAIRSGLVHGVDPQHADYWGKASDLDQRLVELAAIGFALALVPDQVWTPLTSDDQVKLANYLQAARRRAYRDNNWQFFAVMLDLGLATIGLDASGDAASASTADCLDRLETFHLEGGWYRDGETARVDWYGPFAFQFYSLIYLALARGDPDRKARFEARARALAGDLTWWFADDGAALPFGRSLTYRFACAGFWGALAFAGVEALPWGVIKGQYLRHLRWWSRQPITRRDGILSLGYAYPNTLLTETYSSPASPYWAFKAFLPLALPADHPFWRAEEVAAEAAPAVHALPAPGMVMMRQPGQVIALCAGQRHDDIPFGAEKYNKFAYSSRYGFGVERDRQFDRAIVDNMLAFSRDGRDFQGRHGDEEALIAGDLLWARWRPWDDVQVETWLYPQGSLHIRVHRVTTPRRLKSREGGFALPWDGAELVHGQARPGLASARTARDFSLITDLQGGGRRSGRLLAGDPNTNLISPRTWIPQLSGAIEIGTTVLAAAILAGPDPGARNVPRPVMPDLAALEHRVRLEGRPIGAMGAG